MVGTREKGGRGELYCNKYILIVMVIDFLRILLD